MAGNTSAPPDAVRDMRIEIWSDIVCPWCYIGKRRLETALAGFEHASEVELVWRSYQLDPSAPASASGPTETVAEHLGAKYGGGVEGGQQMIDRVEAAAAEEGLLFRLGQAHRVGTFDAHRLLHAAGLESEQRRGELKEALLQAYFVDTENVADHATLTRIATEVGLDAARVEQVLAGDAHADDVEADIRQAAALGATGVPFFVVDGRYGVEGAQPVEVFTQVLERAWGDRAPLSMVTSPDGGEVCEDGTCAV